MNTSNALEKLYHIIEGISDKVEAKKFVSDVVYTAIDKLHEQGLPVSAENLEKVISEKAQDFIDASKNNVA
jgi:hypothetical protein